MDSKFHGFVFVALAIGLCTSVAAGELYTGYWRAHTPSGTSFKCQSVDSPDDLRDVLGRAGWPQSIPSINWSADHAIVVAPSDFYDRAQIEFYGIEPKDSGGYRLKYGWEHWNDEGTTCNGNICSTTSGLHDEPTAETIVIAFPRSLGDFSSFTCKNIGVDP
jgi:hypothetical protein